MKKFPKNKAGFIADGSVLYPACVNLVIQVYMNAK